MVIDNIDWSAIAARMGTRTQMSVADKWYRDCAPSMRDAGTWGPGDDKRLLRFLLRAGAEEESVVPWGDAVRGRTGAAALRRWKLMVKHVPGAVDRGYEGCVDFLVDKFAPALRDEPEDFEEPLPEEGAEAEEE